MPIPNTIPVITLANMHYFYSTTCHTTASPILCY